MLQRSPSSLPLPLRGLGGELTQPNGLLQIIHFYLSQFCDGWVLDLKSQFQCFDDSLLVEWQRLAHILLWKLH